NSSGDLMTNINMDPKSSITVIDLSHYSAGNYYISILQHDKVLKTEKIILVH
ncbi:MAG: hypothetical protein JWN78_729, partial [Bacteroidota bacterium]|nr:hypothetical protein [Bacteroidota bacterium]